MEISWKRINEDTSNIVKEFEKLYTYDRNYIEAEKLITDIFGVYSSKYNIKLDENENFDHIFHQVLDGIKEVMNNYTPTDLADQTESTRIDKLFEGLSDDIFKTTEIRGRLREIDPSNLEYRRALESGIKEAGERKEQIKNDYKDYKDIRDSIFGKNIPDLKTVTNSEYDILNHLDEIEAKLTEIETLRAAMSTMNPVTDASDIEANNRKIDTLSKDIENSTDRIRRTGLVDETKLQNIKVNNISMSQTQVSNLRSEINSRATNDFYTLKNNLEAAKNAHPEIYALAGIDLSSSYPSVMSGREDIMNAYKAFEDICQAFENEIKIYDKEIDIYNEQIAVLDREEEILNKEVPTEQTLRGEIPADVMNRINQDMLMYSQMVDGQMDGNPELKEKYDKYLALFKKHIKENIEFELRDENGEIINDGGVPKKGKYTTVDYVSMQNELNSMASSPDNAEKVEDVIKFLQLEDYKAKIERFTRIQSGDKLSLKELASYNMIKSANTPEEKALAKQAYDNEIAKDSYYLRTFHYAPNDYEFKKQHHATAGKIGETYLPLEQHSRDKGLVGNIKVAGHNLYAYTRWQNPFKAGGIAKGGLTMLLNAGNIVTLLPRMVTKATGYTISKVGYRDDKDPNPYNGRADARRGARADYYKEQGDSAFKARGKAWLDEVFNRKRRQETEMAIKDRQKEEIRKNLIDNAVQGAVESATHEVQSQREAVLRNREIRAQDMRTMAETQEVQGDIIRDPSKVDEKILAKRTMQKTALEYGGVDSAYVSTTQSRDKAKNNQRNTQFVKEKRTLRGITDIASISKADEENAKAQRWTRPKGSVIAADPIGRAVRSREIKNTLTRWYALEQMLLLKGQSALVKWGINKIKDTTPTEVEVSVQDGTKEVKVEADTGHYEPAGTTHKEVIGTREGNSVSKLKMGDLEYGNTAYFEHTASSQFKSVGWIEKPTSANTQAMSLDFKVPSNLSADEYDALAKLGYKAGDRISYSVADEATKNLCQATGRTYSTSYIDGLFNFDDNTNISKAIGQYFPEKVNKAFDIILDSEAYSGDKGVQFFSDSFQTSHGISNVMERMNSWGTGWANETVNGEAIKAARNLVEITKDVPDPDVWVPDLITKQEPIYKIITETQNLTDEAKVALKNNLTRLVNGATLLGIGNSVYDLARKAETKPESGRETYRRNTSNEFGER